MLDRTSVVDDVVSRMTRRMDQTRENVLQTGADRMVNAPWRITKAIYPYGPVTGWPIAGKSLQELLDECRERVDLECARASHWTFDFNRVVLLQQAERALVRLIAEAGDTDEAAAA